MKHRKRVKKKKGVPFEQQIPKVIALNYGIERIALPKRTKVVKQPKTNREIKVIRNGAILNRMT